MITLNGWRRAVLLAYDGNQGRINVGGTMLNDEEWLNRRYYGGDLPAEVERALHEAALVWDEEAAAEAHIRRALELGEGHLAAHLGAYKFFFYRHRLTEALPQAERCLELAAERLSLPTDWRMVTIDMAPFDGVHEGARLYLFALMAVGYLKLRLDDLEDGSSILLKVASLDVADRLGARSLLSVLDARGKGEE